MVPKKASNVGHKRHPASASDKDLKLLETFFEPGREMDGAEWCWGYRWEWRGGTELKISFSASSKQQWLNAKTPPSLPHTLSGSEWFTHPHLSSHSLPRRHKVNMLLFPSSYGTCERAVDCKDKGKKSRGGWWWSVADPVCLTWCTSHTFYVPHLAGNASECFRHLWRDEPDGDKRCKSASNLKPFVFVFFCWKLHLYEYSFCPSRCLDLLTGQIPLRSGKFTWKTSVLISKKAPKQQRCYLCFTAI